MTHKSTTCASTKELCDRTKKIKEEEKKYTQVVCEKVKNVFYTLLIIIQHQNEKKWKRKNVAGGRENP